MIVKVQYYSHVNKAGIERIPVELKVPLFNHIK